MTKEEFGILSLRGAVNRCIVEFQYSDMCVCVCVSVCVCVCVFLMRLILSSPVVTICTTKFNIQQLYVLPTQCIYVFCVDLRTNSDYFPIQH